MKKFLNFLKKEFLEMLPPTIFFFITFSLLLTLRKLMNLDHDFSYINWALAIVSALLMGKAILIADNLKLIHLFNNKALLHRTLWKVIIYLILASFLQYLEEVIPLINENGSFTAASNFYFRELNWYKFIATHTILFLFLFLYVFIVELKNSIGSKEFKKMVFEK